VKKAIETKDNKKIKRERHKNIVKTFDYIVDACKKYGIESETILKEETILNEFSITRALV